MSRLKIERTKAEQEKEKTEQEKEKTWQVKEETEQEKGKTGQKKANTGQEKDKNQNQKEKQKKGNISTYLKYALILGGCMLFGAVLGVGAVFGRESLLLLPELLDPVQKLIQDLLLPGMLLLLILIVGTGEICFRKIKELRLQSMEAEDEEGDRLEYETERITARGGSLMAFGEFLSTLLLTFSYSSSYLLAEVKEGSAVILLSGFAAYILIQIYHGCWGIRIVKLEQKYNPEKKGDPVSLKFTEQWVESCDEAEKTMIYQSAYSVYLTLSRLIPLLVVMTMLAHLVWNTGIMAVLVTAVLQLVITVSYMRNCIRRMERRIRGNV